MSDEDIKLLAELLRDAAPNEITGALFDRREAVLKEFAGWIVKAMPLTEAARAYAEARAAYDADDGSDLNVDPSIALSDAGVALRRAALAAFGTNAKPPAERAGGE